MQSRRPGAAGIGIKVSISSSPPLLRIPQLSTANCNDYPCSHSVDSPSVHVWGVDQMGPAERPNTAGITKLRYTISSQPEFHALETRIFYVEGHVCRMSQPHCYGNRFFRQVQIGHSLLDVSNHWNGPTFQCMYLSIIPGLYKD